MQLANHAGAEVFATASPGKWDFLRAMGVKNVMNSRTLDFADQVLSATDRRGVDIVLNSLSGDYITKSLAALAPSGRFVEIGKLGIWTPEQMGQALAKMVLERLDQTPLTNQVTFGVLGLDVSMPPLNVRLTDGIRLRPWVAGELIPS